jgi:methylthioribose-1-phosphate isomerase
MERLSMNDCLWSGDLDSAPEPLVHGHRATPVRQNRRQTGATRLQRSDQTGGVRVLWWIDEPTRPAVMILDQTRLPAEETTLCCADVPHLVAAIQRLAVRGAPLLGIAGAYGVALAAARGDDVAGAAETLATARPTAVNLAAGVRRARAAYDASGGDPAAALAAARDLDREEAAASAAMAGHGVGLVPEQARVLTHCNTGALAAGGDGTALAVILAAHRAGRLAKLWIDETRPLLQGSRLTAYEAARAGIAHAVLADSAAGSLFNRGEVDLVIVGADRVTADGSVANKVGTYPLAVLAHHHGVPFVVVAPTSTIDLGTPTGASVVIEQRPATEVVSCAGVPTAPPGSPAYNPAFDVTPPELITALVTERGTARPVGATSVARLLGRE